MITQVSSKKITAGSGSNLALSFVSLPQDKRDAMNTFYAFCRIVDDIADDKTAGKKTKQAQLEEWREEISACYQSGGQSPIGKELTEIIKYFLIPPRYFLDILDGVYMDTEVNRYETFAG